MPLPLPNMVTKSKLNCWVILDILVENLFQQPSTFFPFHGHSFVNSLVVIWPIKKWPWTSRACNILCLCPSSILDISWSVQVSGFPSFGLGGIIVCCELNYSCAGSFLQNPCHKIQLSTQYDHQAKLWQIGRVYSDFPGIKQLGMF